MQTRTQYRDFAEECEAKQAEMERQRMILNEMAEAWKKLAEEADPVGVPSGHRERGLALSQRPLAGLAQVKESACAAVKRDGPCRRRGRIPRRASRPERSHYRSVHRRMPGPFWIMLLLVWGRSEHGMIPAVLPVRCTQRCCSHVSFPRLRDKLRARRTRQTSR